MPAVDLHTHSNFSDGTSSPEDVVRIAYKRNVSVLSLTDHDTTDGTERASIIAQELHLPFVPGLEISTRDNDQLHFTGYNIDVRNVALQTFLANNRQARTQRIKQIILQLQQAGVELTEEDVFSRAPNTVSRAHVADALKAKGYAYFRQAAFRQYLIPGKPGYAPAIGVSALEAIGYIKQAGGLAVIAHPGLVRDHWNFAAWKEAGLDGIEIFYPAHSFSLRQELLSIADKYGLFATAGSDYHGPRGGKTPAPGVHIPKNHYDRLLSKLFS